MKKKEVNQPYYRMLLHAEFGARKAKNPRYSLRAFSRDLSVDPAALSRILADKQDLSPRGCASLLRKLRLPPATRRLFLRSVLEDRKQKEYWRLAKSVGEDLTVGTKETSAKDSANVPMRSPFALKAHQLESLRLTIDSLDRELSDQHCLDGVALRVNPAQLPTARALIRQFIEELEQALSCDENGADFQLGIQLCRVALK